MVGEIAVFQAEPGVLSKSQLENGNDVCRRLQSSSRQYVRITPVEPSMTRVGLVVGRDVHRRSGGGDRVLAAQLNGFR